MTEARLGHVGSPSSSVGFAGRHVRASRWLARFLDQECLAVLVLAAVVVELLRWAPSLLEPDTWLALVGGREVASHGLPQHDTLTVWTHGARWIDQQWLSQLTLYRLDKLGGSSLLVGSGIALMSAAVMGVVMIARRRGASARSSALAAGCVLPVIGFQPEVRTQTLALPLFVLVYWLLTGDGGRASRRVLLVLPILVLWANLHGSVVLVAGLASLYGLALCIMAARGRWGVRRMTNAIALLLAAPLTVVASPYGLSLVHYYRLTLGNSSFGSYIDEWHAASFSLSTAPFFALALGTVWLLGRKGDGLSLFERLALPLLIVAGVVAERNFVWFALAAGVSVPLLLDRVWKPHRRTGAVSRLNVGLAVAALSIVAVAAVLFGSARSQLEQGWPAADARAVAGIARAHPSALVFPTQQADWLLWEEPSLAGRLAFDVRFELLSPTRLAQVFSYRFQAGPSWRAAVHGYRILVFGPGKADDELRAVFMREPGARLAYSGRLLSVVVRTAAAAAS
jgi:hypothetical protein